MDSDPRANEKVARYLSAAYIAAVHGAAMDYTRKKYADHPIADFWFELAEMCTVRDHMIQKATTTRRRLAGPSSRRITASR
jgi:hypothetical protein